MINNRALKNDKWEKMIQKLLLPIYLIGIISLNISCENNVSTIKQGITVLNLCFTTQGGNISNELLANDTWIISFSSPNPWITVSPSSGEASNSPIPLIFNATVNNNTQSRSVLMTIMIGERTYTYVIDQDGTKQQSCLN